MAIGNARPLLRHMVTLGDISHKHLRTHRVICRAFPTAHVAWGGHGSAVRNLVALDARCTAPARLSHLAPSFHPPTTVIVAATAAELAELPVPCRASAAVLQAEQRVHSTVADLAATLRSPEATAACDLAEHLGHACPVWKEREGNASAPLVTLEVHFAEVPDTRSECLLSGTPPVECQLPQHHDFAAAAALEWPAHLRRQLGGAMAELTAHDGLLLAHVPAEAVPRAAAALAAQPLVGHVAPRKVQRAHSLDAANAILQGGGDAVSSSAAAERHPAWAAGLTGAGQIIGIGDSGVDTTHCAYVDAAVPVDNFVTDAFRVPRFASEVHRKLALYYACAPPPSSSPSLPHVSGRVPARGACWLHARLR